MMPSVSRKWLAIVGLALISLTSCSGDASSPSESVPPDPLGLELGDGTYDLEGDVDNSDSSLHYEIFVRTYCDSDGDGVGDFAGVASKAGYLQSLGVGAVWLMPINPSNSYHGYDVNDYYSVNPDYGTMADFESMVETLNEHGIDVVIDMVLNHSGLSNPWFSESYKDRQADDGSADSKADWYVWSDESGLNYHSYADAYYLGAFSPSMPEFNWDCAAFRDEVKKILGFWIGKGVSGFRLDATRYYYEFNMEKNVGALDYITDSARSFDPGCYIVGENWTSGSDYYG